MHASINLADAQQIHKVRTAIQGKSVGFVALEKVHGSNFSVETVGSVDALVACTPARIPRTPGVLPPRGRVAPQRKQRTETILPISWG